MRQRLLTAIGMVLVAACASAQTRTYVHPGRVEIRGFGAALTISAAGATNQNVIIRNPQAGTTASAEISVGNDTSATAGRLFTASSTYTPSAPFEANSFNAISTTAGGMAVGALGSGSVRLWAGGAQRALIDSSGRWVIGGTALAAETHIRLTGAYTGVAGAATGVYVDPTLTGAANNSIVGFWSAPTLVEASSGTHSFLIGSYFGAPTVTAGAAAVTNAITAYVAGAPSASGAANYALYVNAGQSVFPVDTTASAPAIGFAGDPDTGMYYVSGQVAIAAQAQDVALFKAAGAGTGRSMIVPGAAVGTGVNSGGELRIGRNSSGNGSPGMVDMEGRTGNFNYLWPDSTGVLRIGTAAPTESGGDTGGTIVGTQTSTWESKDILGRETDGAGALAELLQTPVYRFTYKSGAYSGQQFLGITTRTSPLFGMDQGRSFNPVTSFGVTVLAIQELERRVRALEAGR